jgi:transcriptional regulator with XRE-family HTH domain
MPEQLNNRQAAEGQMVGYRLVNAMENERLKRRMTIVQAAKATNLSKSYYAAIIYYTRSTTTISAKKLMAIAEFLNIPHSKALEFAQISSGFDYTTPNTVKGMIEKSYNKMVEDLEWHVYVPNREDWGKTTDAMKLFTVKLYERLKYERIMHAEMHEAESN